MSERDRETAAGPQQEHPGAEPVVAPDARTIKGLAHPLRVRLLGLLREYGPSTATELGRRVGHSSGVTSYHLRQLADYGFVEEDLERGNGRERWWRAKHRGTRFDPFALDETSRAVGEEYMRAVGSVYTQKIELFLDGLSTYLDTLGREWDQGATLSDDVLWLTPQEAGRLVEEMDELVARYHRDASADRSGRVKVYAQYQVMPQAPGEDAS